MGLISDALDGDASSDEPDAMLDAKCVVGTLERTKIPSDVQFDGLQFNTAFELLRIEQLIILVSLRLHSRSRSCYLLFLGMLARLQFLGAGIWLTTL